MNLQNIFKVTKWEHHKDSCFEIGYFIIIEKQEKTKIEYRILMDDKYTMLYNPEEDCSHFMAESIFHRHMLKKLSEEEEKKIKNIILNYKPPQPFSASNYFLEMIRYINDYWDDNICSHLSKIKNIKTTEVNYISVLKDGFRFLPANKQLILNEDGSWSSRNMQVMKFSKLIRKILKDHDRFTDSQYELFFNKVKSYIGIKGDENGEGKYELQIVEGEDIRKSYLDSNCSQVLCTGGSNPLQSCMRYAKCQPYLDIYVKNPSTIKMLVLKDHEGKVGGRALLWYAKKKKYMDRIYGSDSIITLFKSWAVLNGYHYKNYQSNNNCFDMFNNEVVKNVKVNIPVDLTDIKEFPYLDTLQYFDFEKKFLTNKKPRTKYFILRSTSGGFEIRNDYRYFVDEYTGRRLRTDLYTAVNLDYTLDGERINMTTSIQNTAFVINTHGVRYRILIRDSVHVLDDTNHYRRYIKDDPRIEFVDGQYRLKNTKIDVVEL